MKITTKRAIKPKIRKEAEAKTSGQLGFYVDQTRCTGCYTCAVTCKDWHDVPAGPAKWLRVSTIEKGEFPNVNASFMVSLCYQCLEPACVDACLKGAIRKREEDGIVVVDRDKCMGWNNCDRPSSYKCPP